MSRWDHAQIERGIVNHRTGTLMICLMADCERQAVELHTILEHRHLRRRGVSCVEWDAAMDGAAHIRYPFCSDRHRSMFAWSSGERTHELLAQRGHAYGYLPVGSRGSMQ